MVTHVTNIWENGVRYRGEQSTFCALGRRRLSAIGAKGSGDVGLSVAINPN